MTRYRIKFFIFKFKRSPLYNWRKIRKFKKMSKVVKWDISKYDDNMIVDLAIYGNKLDKLFKKDDWKKIVDNGGLE